MLSFNNLIKKEKLQTIYDTKKSFYGKATVKTYKDNEATLLNLYSYDTLVCQVVKNYNGESESRYVLNSAVQKDLLFSHTTLRHIKEFLQQNMTAKDTQYNELIKKGFTKKNIEKNAIWG